MIHFVIGTRAQLFKLAPVMLECEKRNLNWRWIYTAQHKDTIEESLRTFSLPNPNFTVVNWDTEAKTMGKMWKWLFWMMVSLPRGRKILAGYTGKKNVVVTHGDTITTWWAALLGKLFRCKVMHVEAGMRSFKLFDPFPEEINRLITSRLSDIYVCPGNSALKNLKKYKGEKINTIYNTQADTIEFGLKNCEKADLGLPSGKYIVASIHRYENIFKKDRMNHIANLLEKISKNFMTYFVLHPATNDQLDKLGLRKRFEKNKNIKLINRLEYLPFVKLIKHSEFVVTDGGGNQEELFFMGKPTLLFRNTTERPDELGKTAVLSKLDMSVVKGFISDYKKYQQPRVKISKSPSVMIADRLSEFSQS